MERGTTAQWNRWPANGEGEEDGGDQVDFISLLPDDILPEILSLSLSLREAARTSTLSRRWRNIWRSLPTLDFNIADILDGGTRRAGTVSLRGMHTEAAKYAFLKERGANYCEVVSRILTTPSNINNGGGGGSGSGSGGGFLGFKVFSIVAPLGAPHAPHLDRWIGLAVAAGVRNMRLILMSDLPNPPQSIDEDLLWAKYSLPYNLFSYPDGDGGGCGTTVPKQLQLERLELCFVSMGPLPLGFKGFKSLVRLRLEDVDLKEGLHLDAILSACPVLECLTLDRCSYSYAATAGIIRISHSHLVYVYLDVMNLRFFEMISCSKLSCLCFVSRGLTRVDLAGVAAPHISGMMYGFGRGDNIYGSLLGIPRVAPNLEILTLLLPVPLYETHLLRQLSFAKLKILIMSACVLAQPNERLTWVLSLLMAAPVLESFVLHLVPDLPQGFEGDGGGGGGAGDGITFTHAHLRHVRIDGFLGLPGELQLASCILRHTSASLLSMTISPNISRYGGEGVWIKRKRPNEILETSRRNASQLYAEMPATHAVLNIL